MALYDEKALKILRKQIFRFSRPRGTGNLNQLTKTRETFSPTDSPYRKTNLPVLLVYAKITLATFV